MASAGIEETSVATEPALGANLEPDLAPPAELSAPGWTDDKDDRLIPYGTTNLGTPPELLDHPITPTDVFFVRSNYPIPAVDAQTWRLRVGGLVERPLELSFGDVTAMPQRTITAVLECAGNSRTRFDPPVDGTPWREDAVGNATWTGVPLPYVLDLAGVRPEAVELVSQGGDDPRMQRGLPLAVARQPDTLLAWHMNGESLRTAHGAPLRLLVPGWGGIASTKWLIGLDLVGEPFQGYWNAKKYVLVAPSGEEVGRVEAMPVKSSITEPVHGAVVGAGSVTVAGFAWSGRGEIRQVEVSVDGGDTWQLARIIKQLGARAWARWTYEWSAHAGTYVVAARATDSTGEVQPTDATWNLQGYQMNAIGRTEVVVGERPS